MECTVHKLVIAISAVVLEAAGIYRTSETQHTDEEQRPFHCHRHPFSWSSAVGGVGVGTVSVGINVPPLRTNTRPVRSSMSPPLFSSLSTTTSFVSPTGCHLLHLVLWAAQLTKRHVERDEATWRLRQTRKRKTEKKKKTIVLLLSVCPKDSQLGVRLRGFKISAMGVMCGYNGSILK